MKGVEEVAAILRDQGIEARPCRPTPADSKHRRAAGGFQCSGFYAACGLTLPSAADLPLENLQPTVEALRYIGGIAQAAIEPVSALLGGRRS